MNTYDKLAFIASNLWWSWNPDALALFRRLNDEVFTASGNNPVTTLRYANEEVLGDSAYASAVDEQYRLLNEYRKSEGELSHVPATAYFCMEYGLHESLPLYSGGLGILAGDHLKAASDLGMPFTAVGLFLREGYFKQYFSPNGLQQADYPCQPVTALPAELAMDGRGAWSRDVAMPPIVFVDPRVAVSGTGTRYDPYRTITEGIAAAPVGAIVAVYSDDYREPQVLRKNVTVVTWGGDTVIR